MDSIQQTFINTAKHFPQKTAISQKTNDKWIQISFESLKKRVKALAFFLQKKKIEKGDRVCIILDNCWQWVVIFFAIQYRGAVAVPISPEAGAEEINNIITDAMPSMVFIAERLKSQKINAAGVLSGEGPGFEQLVNADYQDLPIEKSMDDDLACILYTSGTTAKPKGVMLSQQNLMANCNSIDKLHLAKKNDSIVSILPLHHALALTVTLLLPVLYGLRIVYPQTLRGEELLQAMQEQKATIFLAVPQIFSLFHQKIMEKMQKVPWQVKPIMRLIISSCYHMRRTIGINCAKFLFASIHRRFGNSMRLFLSGGARLDSAVAADLYRLGFTILEGYGLTETAPVLTLNPYMRPKFGSVGKPLPDIKIRINNKNAEGVGEVAAQGPNIMRGYYKLASQTNEVLRDNWFYTGDLGYMDKQGYVYLTGRAKDIIVLSSGLNIFPEEIEEIYAQQSPVKEICVFEMPMHSRGKNASMLWAMVVPDLDYFKSIGEVNLKNVVKDKFDNVSRSLPEYKRIRGFSISLESLPRTLLGKIKRFEVKNSYYAEAQSTRNNSAQTKDTDISIEHQRMLSSQTGKKIINYLKQYTQSDDPIVPSDLLELDLGLDSLGRVELAAGLEKEFHLKITDEMIGNAFTVEDLITGVDLIQSRGTETLSAADQRADDWGQRLQALPQQENMKKIDMRPGIGARILVTIFIEIIRLTLFACCRLKINGKQNVPKKGPYIIFANHTSYLDGFIIGSGLPHYARMDIFFLGFRAYFNVPVVRNLIKLGRIIPLDFSTHLLESLRSSYYILSNNKNLCMFPEGSRSVDGGLQYFKKGFGILAKESNAKLVPVYINGAYEAWPRTSKWPKLHPLCVSFAPALDIRQAEVQGFALGARSSYDAVCLGAQQAIQALEKQQCSGATGEAATGR